MLSQCAAATETVILLRRWRVRRVVLYGRRGHARVGARGDVCSVWEGVRHLEQGLDADGLGRREALGLARLSAQAVQLVVDGGATDAADPRASSFGGGYLGREVGPELRLLWTEASVSSTQTWEMVSGLRSCPLALDSYSPESRSRMSSLDLGAEDSPDRSEASLFDPVGRQGRGNNRVHPGGKYTQNRRGDEN